MSLSNICTRPLPDRSSCKLYFVTNELDSFFPTIRMRHEIKRSRALARVEGISPDQLAVTQLALSSRRSGSPKFRSEVARGLQDFTASLLGRPLVILDPETRDVEVSTVTATDGTSVCFDGDPETFDLADFPFEWRLFDPALNG